MIIHLEELIEWWSNKTEYDLIEPFRRHNYLLKGLSYQHNHLEIVKWCFNSEYFKTFDDNMRYRIIDCVASKAAEWGHLNTVKYLTSINNDVATYSLALRSAAGYGHPKIVKYLIRHGADVNYVCGKATYIFVCLQGHQKIANYLLKHSVK